MKGTFYKLSAALLCCPVISTAILSFSTPDIHAAQLVSPSSTDITLNSNSDHSSYSASATISIPQASPLGANKKIILSLDSSKVFTDADCSVSLDKTTLHASDSAVITFTASNFTKGMDYKGTQTVYASVEDDYTADTVPVISGWQYSLDEAKSSILLTRYTGSDKDVVIYPQYKTDAGDKIYNTVLGITTYNTSVDSDGSDYDNDGSSSSVGSDALCEGPFINNTSIESVVFLDGVQIKSGTDSMIASDNILFSNKYYDVTGVDYQALIDAGYTSEFIDSQTAMKLPGYLDTLDSSGNSFYKDIDGNPTVTNISGPNMKGMFAGCSKLKTVKNIPDNVVKMTNTFRDCTSLETVTNLPSACIDMEKTFMGCKKLKSCPQLPSGLKNMLCTFRDCRALNPDFNLCIPDTVTNMIEAFENCQSMEKAPIVSPDTKVRNLYYTFYRCKKLSELPTLPLRTITLFRTFYGCEAAEAVHNSNPHVIGYDIPSGAPLNLIDAYRGTKKLSASIYLNTDRTIDKSLLFDDYEYRSANSHTDYSFNDIFGNTAAPYNIGAYNEYLLLNNRLDEARTIKSDASITIKIPSFEFDVDADAKSYLRETPPKGMFWESALSTSGSLISLHIADNANKDIYKDNFLNASGSRILTPGDSNYNDRYSPTGTTNISVDTYSELKTPAESIKNNPPAVPVNNNSQQMVFNVSFHAINEFTVNFYNGSTLIQSTKVTEGSNATLPSATPVKADMVTDSSVIKYTFDKYVDINGADISFNNIMSDINAYAHYKQTEQVKPTVPQTTTPATTPAAPATTTAAPTVPQSKPVWPQQPSNGTAHADEPDDEDADDEPVSIPSQTVTQPVSNPVIVTPMQTPSEPGTPSCTPAAVEGTGSAATSDTAPAALYIIVLILSAIIAVAAYRPCNTRK